MSIIYTETKSDTDSRTWIDIGDGRNLCINITGEGVIMDVYGVQEDDANGMIRDDLHLGTVGMTFDEWADAMELLLTGESVDAERAAAMGLVWRITRRFTR